MKAERLDWLSASEPPRTERGRTEGLLLRGYGENRRHYVYSLGGFEVETAKWRWIDDRGETLWFNPVEYARLPTAEAALRGGDVVERLKKRET